MLGLGIVTELAGSAYLRRHPLQLSEGPRKKPWERVLYLKPEVLVLLLTVVSFSRPVRRFLTGVWLAFHVESAAPGWVSDVSVFGLRRTLANVGVMARLRYRAPIWWREGPSHLVWTKGVSPNAVGLFDLAAFGPVARFAWALDSEYGGSPRRRRTTAFWLVAGYLAHRSEFVRAPAILYLAASTPASAGLLSRIEADGPGHALAAIDHADVLMERPQRRRSTPDLVRHPQTVLGYQQPEATTLRTRPGEWERTVRDLMDIAPLIVLDLQIPSPQVQREVEWMAAGGHAHKTVVITDGTWFTPPSHHGLRGVATDGAACRRLLKDLTGRRDAIAPRAPQASPELHAMIAEALARRRREVRHVVTALAEHAHEDEHALDREIARLFGAPTQTRHAPATRSLDRVLDLVAGWSRPVSLSIHAHPDGRAECEAGHALNDGFVPLTARGEAGDTTARTLLHALLAVELQAAGEPPSSPLLTIAPSPVVNLRLPARDRRLAHLDSERWTSVMLDDDARRIAAALEDDIRSPAAADIDDRLHELFAIERREDTAGLATSLDAALAFARSLGLGASIYVNLDGTAWAATGGSNRHTAWRWVEEPVELPPAKALLVAILRLLR